VNGSNLNQRTGEDAEMKTRTTRILATTLAATVALTATAWTPATAEKRARTKPNRAVVVEYPVKAKKHKQVVVKKNRRAQTRHIHNARHERYGKVRFRIDRAPRRVIVRPVYAGAFVINRPRFVVVRPVPVWVQRPSRSNLTVSVRFGKVVLAAATSERAPRFGCNFCDAHFGRYGAWERHVMNCAHWRSPVRVIAVPWDDGDVEYFRQQAFDTYWEDERVCVTYRDW
jgi:hypothetical protein